MTEQRLPEHTFGRSYVVVFPEAVEKLSADPKAMPALRVLVWAWGKLNYQSFKSLRQEDIAASLCMSRPSVNLGLKRLLAEGLVERKGRGPRQEWRLTPEGGWKGRASAYQKELRERRKSLSEKGKVKLAVIAGGRHGEGQEGEAAQD